MMERLQTLFLGEGVSEVKFRWLVFYGITVMGFAFGPLQSWLFAGNPLFGYSVVLYPFYFVWTVFGAMGALVAFKPERREKEERQAEALASFEVGS